MLKEGWNKNRLSSHQATGEAALITCAVQDDVLDEPKDFRVFVDQQIFWVCEARQVTQPEKSGRSEMKQFRMKENTESFRK